MLFYKHTVGQQRRLQKFSKCHAADWWRREVSRMAHGEVRLVSSSSPSVTCVISLALLAHAVDKQTSK